MNIDWLAGFFDGEGCVNITVRGKSRQVVLRVTIINTDFSLLEKIKSSFGGSLSRREQKKNPHWKPFCSLEWRHHEAFAILELMAPHLHLKTRQAELAMEFYSFQILPKKQRCEVVLSNVVGFPGTRVHYRRTKETLEKEIDFKLRMNALNKKGA